MNFGVGDLVVMFQLKNQLLLVSVYFYLILLSIVFDVELYNLENFCYLCEVFDKGEL